MARTQRSTAPQEPNLDSSLVIALVICALIAAGIGYWRMGPGRQVTDEDISFEAMHVDADKLDAARQQMYAGVHLNEAQAEWQALLQTARKLNQTQFDASASPADLQTLGAKLRFQANDVVPATGFDGFVASGEPMFRACKSGLDKLLGAVRAGKLDIEQAQSDPPANQFADYRQNCGNILPVLLERGLITEDGQWSSQYAPVIADLLSRYRWAHIIGDQRDPKTQLTPYGGEILARWRVEDADGYTYAQRQRFLQELAQTYPDYDATYARGVLAYQNGDLDAALDAFESLAKAHPDAAFEGYVAFLREQGAHGPHDPTAGSSETNPAETEKTH